jgi:hypothetical protein
MQPPYQAILILAHIRSMTSALAAIEAASSRIFRRHRVFRLDVAT